MTSTSSHADNVIAYQGVPGAYSQLACRTRFPDMDTLPLASFEDMLQAVVDGDARYAMVPVENSLAGRVADIHHLLPSSGLSIIGEHFQPVHHHLLGIKGTTLDQLTSVKSHAQGLAQCRNGLRKLGLIPEMHPDTAGAASDVAAMGDASVGAIASSLAAEIYGLDILKAGMEDASTNTTRMLIMAKNPEYPANQSDAAITTLIFRLRSVPAALYKALGGFATNGINLTKLESYMLDGHFTAVQFYIDAETHVESPAFALALEELEFFCPQDAVTVLGCYPADAARYDTGGNTR
ncbi:prephenate dehydratase [Alphaproteobacteria bacterium]|jgi:prephenate dehydratase|nr:prephenate dehydratase [Alphaproteobacteria bacterium]